MTGLETAFYIIAIIFMFVMFSLIVALMVVVLAIRAKINHMQLVIEQKLRMVSAVAEKGSAIIGTGDKIVRVVQAFLKKRPVH